MTKKESNQQTKTNNTRAKAPQDSSKNTKTNNTKVDSNKILESFVSNVDGNIYAVAGLPEEFVATLFAWVSRSPKSFKEHLKEAIQEFDIKPLENDQFKELSEKAKKFHEKWTVDYGHGSVGEHAVVHVGIEKVSRMLSEDLELASDFLSITEYSQRYQQPQAGDWINPYKTKTDKDKYETLMSKIYKNFEALIKILVDVHVEEHKEKHKKNPTQKERRAYEKLAFEDARYILPVSMHTQLGVTANARAWQDVVAELESSPLPEYKEVANALREEISKVTPTLLRHTKPSNYKMKLVDKHSAINNEIKEVFSGLDVKSKDVTILNAKSEEKVIEDIFNMLVLKGSSFEKDIKALNISYNKKKDIVELLLQGLDFFDQLDGIFKMSNIEAVLAVSEANWHQLLRHNRSTSFVKGGYTGNVVIPPYVKKSEKALSLFNESIKLIDDFRESNTYEYAESYLYTNAHEIRVRLTGTVWSLYHLINLRSSEEAQWEIRDTFNKVNDKLNTIYPTLFKYAKRRQ